MRWNLRLAAATRGIPVLDDPGETAWLLAQVHRRRPRDVSLTGEERPQRMPPERSQPRGSRA
jgi:hypothetical protein